MVEIDPRDTYRDRLGAAMERAGCSIAALAEHLGVTEFAIKKLFKGESHTLSLMNHFKAAEFLKVDPTRLALGDDAPIAAYSFSLGPPWPFPRVDAAQVLKLSDRELRIIENEMLATADDLKLDIRKRESA